MRRKLFLNVTVLLIFTMVLAACGNDKKSEPSPAGDDQEVVYLQYWGGIPAENGPQEAVDTWNAANPLIQVEYMRYVNDPSGNLRVNTALQTGETLDILMSHNINDFQQRVASKFVLDLGTFDDYDIEAKMGPTVQEWKMDGTYYALPTNVNARFVLLNMDALEEQGLEIPVDWNWEDVQEYAKKLTTENRYGYAIDANTYYTKVRDVFLNVDFQDGKSSNLGHPDIRKVLNTVYNMIHEDKSVPLYGEQIASDMAVDSMFLNGEIAMYNAGAWKFRMTNDLTEYPRDFKIGFAPAPKNFDGSRPGHSIGDSLSVVASSKYPEQAWAFIKWYADEGMIALSPGGRVPLSVDAPIEEALNLIVKGAEDSYELQSLQAIYELDDITSNRVAADRVIDIIKREFEKYFLKDQSLDETIDNMAKSHNQILAQ